MQSSGYDNEKRTAVAFLGNFSVMCLFSPVPSVISPPSRCIFVWACILMGPVCHRRYCQCPPIKSVFRVPNTQQLLRCSSHLDRIGRHTQQSDPALSASSQRRILSVTIAFHSLLFVLHLNTSEGAKVHCYLSNAIAQSRKGK